MHAPWQNPILNPHILRVLAQGYKKPHSIRTMAVRLCDSLTMATEPSRAARIRVMLMQIPK